MNEWGQEGLLAPPSSPLPSLGSIPLSAVLNGFNWLDCKAWPGMVWPSPGAQCGGCQFWSSAQPQQTAGQEDGQVAGHSEDGEEAADLKGESPTGGLGNVWKPQENEGICCKMWAGLPEHTPSCSWRTPLFSNPSSLVSPIVLPQKPTVGMRLRHPLLYLSMERP